MFGKYDEKKNYKKLYDTKGDAPYQIRTIKEFGILCALLVDTRNNEIIDYVDVENEEVEALKLMQAKLNSEAVLDEIGIF